MGVAVMTRTCGDSPLRKSRARCATPKRCCSSTTTRPSRRNCTGDSTSACVPTRTSMPPGGELLEQPAAAPARGPARSGARSARPPPVSQDARLVGVLLGQDLRRRHQRPLDAVRGGEQERETGDDRLAASRRRPGAGAPSRVRSRGPRRSPAPRASARRSAGTGATARARCGCASSAGRTRPRRSRRRARFVLDAARPGRGAPRARAAGAPAAAASTLRREVDLLERLRRIRAGAAVAAAKLRVEPVERRGARACARAAAGRPPTRW